MNLYVKFVRVAVAAFAATVAFFIAAGVADAHGQKLVIEITGFEFVIQEEIELHKGDVVVWVNRDIAPHTATANDGSWNSGMLKTGESWELVITEDTLAAYYCVYHPSMTGTIPLEDTAPTE